MILLALLLGEIDKSLIGNGLHESIAQKIQRNAEGANLFRVRHALLNFRAGEGAVRADGAVVHQGTAFDNLGSAGDGDFGILKFAVGAAMTSAQFIDLAGAAGGGILMALSARLRVIERAEAVGDGFGFLKPGLIRRVGRIVHQTVAFAVETRRRFGKGRGQ